MVKRQRRRESDGR